MRISKRHFIEEKMTNNAIFYYLNIVVETTDENIVHKVPLTMVMASYTMYRMLMNLHNPTKENQDILNGILQEIEVQYYGKEL